MPNALRNRVEKWLANLGCTPTEQDDPQTEWHLGVDFPVGRGHQMHLVQPKGRPDAVIVATRVEFSPPHVKAFQDLPDDEKREFLYGLGSTLNQLDLEFQLEGVDGELDLPDAFQVSCTRYSDGLSMDEFAWTMGAVFKLELRAILYVRDALSSNGLGGGGRFDFKRLGV